MVGITQKIPEGWSVKKLEDIAKLERGKFSIRPRNDPSCYGGCFPFVQTGDVARANVYLNEFSQTLNDKGLSVSKLFPANVILITIAANIGETAITTFPVCCPDSLVAITGNKSNLIWLNYVIKKHKNELNSLATQNAQKNINLETLRPLKILTPPLPEQEKIAGILSCWDDGIEKLSALIEQKKLLKKGLMQQLLTGKHLLKGFSTPWHKVKLGELLINVSERNKELKISQVLSVTNSKGFILPEEQFSRNVASEDLSNYKIVRQGDFAYNPSRINVGSIDQLNNFESGLLSPMYVVFRCNEKLLDLYMKHFIKSSEFVEKINCSAQGSVRETVDFKTLASIKMKLSSDPAEQKAIAEILSKADEEIELLNKKLEAFKQEKKALMQQLLTGKIRVKVN